MPVDTDIEKQSITGPDGKIYKFSKGISQARIDKYFAKKGITKSKGDSGPTKGQVGLMNKMQNKALPNPAMPDYSGELLPTAGGMVGGVIGGRVGSPKGGAVVGSAIGGMAGEASRELWRHLIFNENITAKDAVVKTAVEGAKQGALEYGGQKVGEIFFKMLSKIPHAELKGGIPFLPSELEGGSKIMSYVEDLLGNLFPSAKVMEDFKAGQSKVVLDKINTFTEGMSRFKGTSEEMGVAVQKALKEGKASAEKSVEALRKSYIKKGMSPAQVEANLAKTNVQKNLVREYENQLARSIIATNKPELIAGLLRSSGAADNEIRILHETLSEMKPETLGKVQNRIMRDIVQETLTGSKDPVAKGTANLAKKFSGDRFKQILDHTGEEKLKAIYGEQGYNNIEEFTKLVGMIKGEHKSGVGKFMNLMLFISPIRSGFTPKTLGKTTGLAFLTNRLAKIITSTEGVQITNNYVRATLQNSPRLINAAIDEFKKYNERSDAEFLKEEQEGERQYNEQQKGK